MKEHINKLYSDLHSAHYNGDSLILEIFDGDIVIGRDAMPEWERRIRNLFADFHPDVDVDKELETMKRMAGLYVKPVSEKEAKYLEKKLGREQLDEWDRE